MLHMLRHLGSCLKANRDVLGLVLRAQKARMILEAARIGSSTGRLLQLGPIDFPLTPLF